jgi:hypothetical protein
MQSSKFDRRRSPVSSDFSCRRSIRPDRPLGHASTKRPVCGMSHKTTLHRVEVGVVQVSRKVSIIADRALPVPAAANCRVRHGWSWPVIAAYGRAKLSRWRLDGAPAAGEVGIACRQGPQAVHMVGKDDPGVDVEGRVELHLPNSVPQHANLRSPTGLSDGRAS